MLSTRTVRNSAKKEQCMDRIQYNILKEKYGKVASWLIYDEDYGNYEKNFHLIESSVDTVLNPKYLFCGLNAILFT